MSIFKLNAKYKPAGDQSKAIEKLVNGLKKNFQHQTLLGVTGSGKTFTMANVIASYSKPTLVVCHNKTLAAQLYGEFKEFFPDNAVHYFVSYFDYYQPEAYIPQSDTYIEKDSSINEEIDRLRHSATSSLLSRRDVLIVASVSCIYGLGSVEDYANMTINLEINTNYKREKLLRRLNDIQYLRNDYNFDRGTFRVRGEVIEILPSYEEYSYRLEFFGDTLDKISRIDTLTGEIKSRLDKLNIFPNKHYVTPREKLESAFELIKSEASERIEYFQKKNMILESQRLTNRINHDIEIMQQTGYVKGIENYSRYLTDREPGEQPATLLDYYPDDFLMFIDESHMTVPQIRGMYNGDYARKKVLIDNGFRLPSAFDNRPLKFNEFEGHINRAIYVSATPNDFETNKSMQVVEQIIRPTGLVDPEVEIRPTKSQVDDLLEEVRIRIKKRQRVLVTTLTKRLAEDLTEYLSELGIKVQYLHSDIDTLERNDILYDLRKGKYDVLVGINLLREGLDLPEVSLVAIFDADKEGFLRSDQSLIQTFGRAARHIEGKVIMYADKETGSMERAILETSRRRRLQIRYNKKHQITPTTITKALSKEISAKKSAETSDIKELDIKKIPDDELKFLLKQLIEQMELSAANLQFEKAAELRDQISEIKDIINSKKIK